LLSPKKIVAAARDMGVTVLIVTDHDTIQGSLDVRAIAGGNPPVVITAAEYHSEKGDIIGLFLKEEIRSRHSAEIIRQIREQDGVAVLPHPYKGHILDDELLANVDLIESYNSRCSDHDNAEAEKLRVQWRRPVFAGADAHSANELSAAVNEFMADPPQNESEFRKQLLHVPRRIATKPTSSVYRPYSQMIKAVRTGDPRLFLYQAKRLALLVAHGSK
jgi:hypothetical protein